MTDPENKIFSLAVELVNNTNQHIFLTGKAGTGKTTFLKYIKENTIKNTVVVAPTGVAAINAGGVTLHSFFQLPFGPYIPQNHSGSKFGNNYNNVSDKNTLFKNIRFNNEKRKLLNELQLLIIDEISMVRSDILDAVDTILRHFRRNLFVPFGGVQVLYIGDMYQLPPVIHDAEWKILEQYYNGPFFFNANVIEESKPLYIELKKIYRQKDTFFIDILNRVRNNHTTEEDLTILNDLYKPNFNYKDNNTILLTTHNAKADTINEKELNNLNNPLYVFKGEIEGDFNDKLLPNDFELKLKEGAQIMFIKNDSTAEKKYYNGKLAKVKKIEGDKITVEFYDETTPFELKKESWKNIRYKLTDDSQIEEEELGSYTQFPIRLAWAVTIHKSQGLTFKEVIIDAGKSFAAGQVYVALSRCTNLEGITLHSIIPRHAINTDERIIAFSKNENKEDELQRVLAIEKNAYIANQLLAQFNFSKLVINAESFLNLLESKKIPNQNEGLELCTNIKSKAIELENISEKFKKELKQLLIIAEKDRENLIIRTQKAIDYFTKEIIDAILIPLQNHISALKLASKVKLYLVLVEKIELEFWVFLVKLNQTVYDDIVFNKNKDEIEKYNPLKKIVAKKLKKLDAGESLLLSLDLFNEGKSIEQISLERNLTISTIEGHLAQHVRKGNLDIYKLINKDDVDKILVKINEIEGHNITPIKVALNDEYSYNQIRAVLNYKDFADEQHIKA